MDGHEVFARAALLDGTTSCGVNFTDNHFKPTDSTLRSDVLAVLLFSLSGSISDGEPGVLNPDVKLQRKFDAISGTVKQPTRRTV